MKTFKINPWSNFTADDLAIMEQRIIEAQAVYDERKAAYDYSISVGHERYAKRVRKPPMDAAKAAVDELLSQYREMQQTVSANQNIDLTDISMGQATGTIDTVETNSESWRTWAYVGGVVLVIFVVYKLM